MRSSKELTELFLSDLKVYNTTNFKTIAKADLSKQDATVHKSFSSVITRYFIFKEKHPEVTEVELKMLYFKLKLDMIALYFSEYPDTTTDNLVAFQIELKRYVEAHRRDHNETEDTSNVEQQTPISNIGLEPNNTMPVKQQQEPEPVTV